MPDLRIEYMPLRELRRARRNPKSHDVAVIDESLNRWGFLDRIIINKTTHTGHLISGHGRVAALTERKAANQAPPEGVTAKKDGDWSIPVDRVELSEPEEEAAALALNRIAERGGWHDGLLAEVLADMVAQGDGVLQGIGHDIAGVDVFLEQTAWLNPPG